MSFKFGDFDTAATPGMLATLQAWPGLALTPETVDLLDGAFYARTRTGSVAFTFDVLLKASTPAGVLAMRDTFVAGVAPHLGLRALTPEAGEGWVWWASTSAIPEFKRGLWVKGVECQLSSEVSFLVPDGVGWAYPDDTADGVQAVTLTRMKGNLPSFPTITVEGPFAGVTLNVGGRTLVVDVPVPAGRRLVLDYRTFDFGVWQGATKVAHAAPGMSTLERMSLPMGATTITATATGGAVSSLSVAANSRRA